MTPTQQRVYAVVSRIPRGKVLTYGDVAKLAGIRNPRIVGSTLHKNEDWKRVPCHRVVNSVGRLAPSFGMGGCAIQEERLLAERVTFKRRSAGAKRPGIVDLKRHRWSPSAKDLR